MSSVGSTKNATAVAVPFSNKSQDRFSYLYQRDPNFTMTKANDETMQGPPENDRKTNDSLFMLDP